MLQRQDPEQVLLYKRVISCVEGFAPLPSVAMRVLEIAADSETTVLDLEEVLEGDVSLVAAVLKLANSAFYGLRRQVDSLKHALTLLGKSEVMNIVLVKVMFRSFKASFDRQQVVMTIIWRHSLECALAAECLGEMSCDENPLFFLVGMLHDVGKVLIVSEFFSEVEGVPLYGYPGAESFKEVEKEKFGCSHDKLGSQLLDRWLFPVSIVQMVAEHHDYEKISDKKCISKVLILANLLSRLVTLKDWEHTEKNRNAELEKVHSLLLSCGKTSKMLPDEESLEIIEKVYRQRLDDKRELLDLMLT